MRAVTTPAYTNYLIDDLKDQFTNQSNTYITIGRQIGTGANSTNVEDIIYTTNQRNQFYRNMVGAKKIAPSDIQVVIPRVDWANSVIYDTYEDNVEIFSYDDFQDLGTANANSNSVLSGTVSVLSFGQPVVTGSGTEFTKYLFVGDQISVNSEVRTVLLISNDTSVIVNNNFSYAATGVPLTLLSNSTIIVANSANFIGNLAIGNTVTVGAEIKEVVAIRSNQVIAVNSGLTLSYSNTNIFRKDNTYPFTANTFYVRNSRDQVFKCLFNGNNTPSVIEPTIDIDGQLPENAFILTADGYKWKYMYTIPPGLKQKFFTNRWMPVVSDPAVKVASTDGRIDIIRVLWGGSGYLRGSNSNTAAILQVTGTDGQGANLIASVTNGNITSVTILTGGNNYTEGTVSVVNGQQLGSAILGGTVNVSGTVVTANLANTSNQSFLGNVFVNDIITVNNESRNVVTVINSTHLTVNTGFSNSTGQIALISRSNAQFDIQIGPPGGHGSNPAKELRAHSLMVTVEFDGTENSTIPISDNTNTFDFNQVGILVDPLVANGAYTANLTNYRATSRLLVSAPGIFNFIDDETVFVGESLENAVAVANVAHWDTGSSYLYINNITGSFAPPQVIKGVTSGVTLPILSVANSDLKLFSGNLIYMENRSNVIRKDDQIDQVKIILSF